MQYGRFTFILVFCVGRAASAQASYESRVRGAAAQSFVTVVEADQPSARAVSAADLIERQAGVQVRSRGGLGAFSAVSIRGSEVNQVAVLVDGLPLTRAAAGLIDLSQIPASAIERIEIWRGVPPADLGSDAIGGAINIIMRKGTRAPGWRLALGGGSFAARSVSAGVSGTFRGVTTDVSAAYQGANGDFLYYDTAGTLATDVDDRATRRRNNHFDQGSLDLTASWGRKVRWQAGAHGFIKHQGTPGPAIAGGETVNARLTTGRMLASLGASGARGLFDGQARAHVLYERVTFVNPEGELVGPFGPNVSEGEALAAGLSLRSRVRAPRQLFSFLGDARVEHRWPYNLLFPDKAGAPSTRVVGAVGVADDVRLASGRVAFTPALRLDGAWSRIAASSSIPVQEATSLFVSPRLTARAEATSWLALRGSAGRFVRFPTLLELFGDGAFILPRPLLAPESAWGGDFGFTVGLGGAWGRFVLEAAFFGRQVSDTIAFVVGGVAATAENLGETRMLGAEARLEAELFRFARVRFDYTFVDPIRVDSGNLLPGRSPHEAHLRLELRRAPFSIFYDLDYQDRAFRDPANAAYVPERVLHAIGAAFDRGDVLFTAEIRNLADLRTLEIPLGTAGRTTSIPLVDFFNYPLPGRAIYATLAVRH